MSHRDHQARSRRSRDFAIFKAPTPLAPQIDTTEFPPFPSSLSPSSPPNSYSGDLPHVLASSSSSTSPPPSIPSPPPNPNSKVTRMTTPTPSQKLTIRPPPHVDFVQSFPGVPPLPLSLQITSPKGPGQRLPAHLAGTVEVRPGPKGIKVSWLRIELKKVEVVPSGAEGGGRERHSELIGSGPQVLWRKGKGGVGVGANGKGGGKEEDWETMNNRDFNFSIALPEALPPTVILDAKGCGIFYELVASLATKPKKSFLSSSKQPLLIQSVPITLEKHDLHCAWPMYRPVPPETRNVILQEEGGGVVMSFERKLTCYGPGDSVWVRLSFKSERIRPVRVRGIEVVISEVITFKPMVTNNKGSKTLATNAEQRTSLIVDSKVVPNQMLYRGEPFTIDIKGTVPPNHPRVTVRNGKHIQVSYQLAVRALLDGFENGKDRELIVDHLPTTISGFPFKQGALLLEKIGWDERLCAGRGLPDQAGSGAGPGGPPGSSAGPSGVSGAGGAVEELAPIKSTGPPPNFSNGMQASYAENRFSSNANNRTRLSMTQSQAYEAGIIPSISSSQNSSTGGGSNGVNNNNGRTPGQPIVLKHKASNTDLGIGVGASLGGFSPSQSPPIQGASSVGAGVGGAGVNGARTLHTRTSSSQLSTSPQPQIGNGRLGSSGSVTGVQPFGTNGINQGQGQTGSFQSSAATSFGVAGSEKSGLGGIGGVGNLGGVKESVEMAKGRSANPNRPMVVRNADPLPGAAWESAEEEKRRLAAKHAYTQPVTQQPQSQTQVQGQNDASNLQRQATSSKMKMQMSQSPPQQPQQQLPPQVQQFQQQNFPSAAEEKARLFEEAKEIARIRQSEAQGQNFQMSGTTNGTVQAVNGAGYMQQNPGFGYQGVNPSMTGGEMPNQQQAQPQLSNQGYGGVNLQHAAYPSNNLGHSPYPSTMGLSGYTSYGHSTQGSTSTPLTAPSPAPSNISATQQVLAAPIDEKAQLAAYYKAKEDTARFRAGLDPSEDSGSGQATSLTPAMGGANNNSNLQYSTSVRSRSNFYPTNAIPANPAGTGLYSQQVAGSSMGMNSSILPPALVAQPTGASSSGAASTNISDERMRYYEAIRQRDALANPGAPAAAPYKSAEEEKAELKKQLEKSEITKQLEALPTYSVPASNFSSPPQQTRSEKAEMAAYYAAREATERFTAEDNVESAPASEPAAAMPVSVPASAPAPTVASAATVQSYAFQGPPASSTLTHRRASSVDSDGSIERRDPEISKGKRPMRSGTQSPELAAQQNVSFQPQSYIGSQPTIPEETPLQQQQQNGFYQYGQQPTLQSMGQMPIQNALNHAPYPSMPNGYGYGYMPAMPFNAAAYWQQPQQQPQQQLQMQPGGYQAMNAFPMYGYPNATNTPQTEGPPPPRPAKVPY